MNKLSAKGLSAAPGAGRFQSPRKDATNMVKNTAGPIKKVKVKKVK